MVGWDISSQAPDKQVTTAAEPQQYIHFDGPCPFLTCLETEPHDHPICPDCGAVRWGNMFCKTCRSHWPKQLQHFRSLLDAAEEEL